MGKPYENDLQMVGHPWSNHPFTLKNVIKRGSLENPQTKQRFKLI